MQNNMIDLREKLKTLPTEQLARMLRTEVDKETPDDDLVLTILALLEEQRAGEPVELSAAERTAWANYQARRKRRVRKPSWLWLNIVKAASIVLIVSILFITIPATATAGSFWKILTSWSDDIFEYVNIGSSQEAPEEYVFQSDNPGLKQVYDTVVAELGETRPVVVSWLPEGNELEEIKIIDTDAKKSVHAKFVKGDAETILMFDQMKLDLSPQFDKIETRIVEFEANGIIHNLIFNEDVCLASWARDNIKCSICIDCQEDALKKIIRSIY